jgi:hypothetical protein
VLEGAELSVAVGGGAVNFELWLSFPKTSATYAADSLARAVRYSEWEEAMLKISAILRASRP